MTPEAEQRSEVLKLDRLIGPAPDGDLSEIVAGVPADELRDYREAVTRLVFDAERGRLKPTANAASVVPVRVLATIAERALGPLVCARLASYIDPERAAEIAARLEPTFLAEVAAELDPRQAAEVVGMIPAETIRQVAVVMAAAGEDVPMGRFVAQLDHEPLAAAVAALPDESLVRTGYVLEGKERLDEIFALLDDERIGRLAALAEDEGLATELSDLRAHLGAEQGERFDRLATPAQA